MAMIHIGVATSSIGIIFCHHPSDRGFQVRRMEKSWGHRDFHIDFKGRPRIPGYVLKA
jgi:hypothetical protein